MADPRCLHWWDTIAKDLRSTGSKRKSKIFQNNTLNIHFSASFSVIHINLVYVVSYYAVPLWCYCDRATAHAVAAEYDRNNTFKGTPTRSSHIGTAVHETYVACQKESECVSWLQTLSKSVGISFDIWTNIISFFGNGVCVYMCVCEGCVGSVGVRGGLVGEGEGGVCVYLQFIIEPFVKGMIAWGLLTFVHALSMPFLCLMILKYTLIWHDMVWWCDMIWYDMIWYDIIWYDMIWYEMIWYDMIWYDTIWGDMIWLSYLV